MCIDRQAQQQQQQPDPAIIQLGQSLEQLTQQVRKQGDALDGLTKRLDAMSDDLKALNERPEGAGWWATGMIALVLLLSLATSVLLFYVLPRKLRHEIYGGNAAMVQSIRMSAMETRTRIDRVDRILDELWRRVAEATSATRGLSARHRPASSRAAGWDTPNASASPICR